jgi:hypothetical protein
MKTTGMGGAVMCFSRNERMQKSSGNCLGQTCPGRGLVVDLDKARVLRPDGDMGA